MHIVRFQGGFANQLFQLAFYYKLIEDQGQDNVFADLSFYDGNNDHGGFKLDPFVNLKLRSKLPKDILYITEKNIDKISSGKSMAYYYNGYWQDRSFFPKDLSFLDRIFSRDKLDSRSLGFLERIEKSASVSIHVRRGDYIDNYKHGNIANKAYFENSIKYLFDRVKNPNWFVFSDDIDWCRNNLSFPGGVVEYVEGNENAVQNDIFLMSCCRNNIISNSSFSWWAQEINHNTDKIVVSPEYWYNDGEKSLNTENAVHIPNVPYVDTESTNPRFSIIIPVYNCAYCIRRCLSTALNQTIPNIEIIAVDDGSEDSSLSILKEYSRRDKRLKLIVKEKNESLLSARLAGMKAAFGDYILFLDSDDYLSLATCEILLSYIEKNSSDIIEFPYYLEPEKNIVKSLYDDVLPKEKNFFIKNEIKKLTESIISGKAPHTVWNKCYSGKLIKRFICKADDFYCNMSEDIYYTSALFTLADSYCRIDEILYHYLNHGGMSTDYGSMVDNISRIVESVANKNSYLQSFLKKNDSTKLALFEGSIHNEIGWIARCCKQSERSLRDKLNALYLIDKCFGTGYAEKFEEYYKQLDNYVKSGRKRRFKLLIKELAFVFAGKKNGNLEEP